MADETLIGDLIGEHATTSRWAVAAFIASCTFTGGALLLLFLSWI